MSGTRTYTYIYIYTLDGFWYRMAQNAICRVCALRKLPVSNDRTKVKQEPHQQNCQKFVTTFMKKEAKDE